MVQFLQLIRINQWVKNIFIFFPLVFSGQLRNTDKLTDVILSLCLFCCVASSVYIWNDYLDLKKDRLHPKKKDRPLSQGSINVHLALTLAIILALFGLSGGFWINHNVGGLLLGYLLLHVIYNMYAKNVVLLDVFFIALGFQLRILVGSMAAGVVPSVWLQMCVFVLSLFLGFTKRRSEIFILKERAVEHRPALLGYNLYLLDQFILIVSTLTVLFYGLYTISQEVVLRVGGTHMIYSQIFVIFGLFRYLYLVHVKKLGDEPGDILLSDWPTLVNCILWLVYMVMIIYIV